MIKKIFYAIVLIFMATAIFSGCLEKEVVISSDETSEEDNFKKNIEAEKKDKNSKSDAIEEQLKSMSIEEKIGQMVMIGVQGTAINQDITFLLSEFHFGGVILYDRNMETFEQTKKFVEDIKSAADKKAPLLLALDEEGGIISRGKDTVFPKVAPSQEYIGQGNNPAEAAKWAMFNADLLRSIGLNLNFAPVADVGSKDTRSFGYDAATVTAFVDASANGYEQKNFLYTLKHFPGIGKSKVDPHKEVSNIEDSEEILKAEDFPPFEKIIREHDNSKFMVMVGHLKYDALDPNNSASLSPIIIEKILRNELGFKGVVITDDLEMGAIKNNVDVSTLGVKMIQAGGDVALVCHDYASQQAVYNGILKAVERGEISEERINESVRRILKLKANLK